MKTIYALAITATAFIGTASLGADHAAAQVNCSSWPHGAARANCYRRQAEIYRQQSRDYNAIADGQYQQHRRIGRALRRAPIFGRYAAPAWNAPRHYNTYRNWRRR